MYWVFFLVLLVVNVWSGIRRDRRAGVWSWSKFFFALSFGLMESALLFVAIAYMAPHSSHRAAIIATASMVTALNFIWFVIVMRRWRLPDGRTSLQAYRDEQSELHKGA